MKKRSKDRSVLLTVCKLDGTVVDPPLVYISDTDALKLEILKKEQVNTQKRINGGIALDVFEFNYINAKQEGLPRYAVRSLNKIVRYAEKQLDKDRIGILYFSQMEA